MIERTELGDRHAVEQVALIEAELDVLQDLEVPPVENLPSLRRVSQSRRYPVWRVAHPFVEGTAIRLIVWFPPERPAEVVIVLFGADKAQMGDVSTTASDLEPTQRSTASCTAKQRRNTAMSDKTTFVGPERATQKRARARAVPGVAQRAAQVRAEIAETDGAYADSLAAIRHAADLTQVALTQQMGVPQTVVSRLERQHDMLLSTLNSYLRAAGERPRVIVTINGHDVELDLATLGE